MLTVRKRSEAGFQKMMFDTSDFLKVFDKVPKKCSKNFRRPNGRHFFQQDTINQCFLSPYSAAGEKNAHLRLFSEFLP